MIYLHCIFMFYNLVNYILFINYIYICDINKPKYERIAMTKIDNRDFTVRNVFEYRSGILNHISVSMPA